MRRGTLCWVDLSDARPPEMGKIRPCVVVSNSSVNAALQTVVIVPLSSQPEEVWPLRLRVEFPAGKSSYAVIPGIRQVARRRLLDPSGLLPSEDMNRVEAALRIYLGDAGDYE
ncbi:MAG TPA: type II toxin-antitoxin system PemK/MazF family toxin [Kiritimatiellia bacterium]|nr:type II toxin-antitoxin system PemK/MazF family toxin [Kiritimatiellia bacterium]